MDIEVRFNNALATNEMIEEVRKVIMQAYKEWHVPMVNDHITISVKNKHGIEYYIHCMVITISYTKDAVLYVVGEECNKKYKGTVCH